MAGNSSSLRGIENFPIYMVYSVGGIIIGGSNMMICLSIARYEALRTNKVYVLIMAQSFADSFNMMGFTIGGICRSWLIVSGTHNTMYTVWQCAQVPHTIIWSTSVILANVMLFVTSIDRLLSVQYALRYIGWSRKYTMTLVGLAYLYSIVCGIIGFIWAYTTKDNHLMDKISATCVTPNVFRNLHKLYHLHLNQASLFWAFLAVCIYIVVWIIYKYKNSQVNSDIQGQQHQVEHQRKFTKSLGISCMCTFWLFVVPWQLGIVANNRGHRSLAMALWTGSNLNPMANVIIYMKRHEEIRQALKGLFACKHMPIDLQTWKANNEAGKAQNMAHIGHHSSAKKENQVNVEEL